MKKAHLSKQTEKAYTNNRNDEYTLSSFICSVDHGLEKAGKSLTNENEWVLVKRFKDYGFSPEKIVQRILENRN